MLLRDVCVCVCVCAALQTKTTSDLKLRTKTLEDLQVSLPHSLCLSITKGHPYTHHNLLPLLPHHPWNNWTTPRCLHHYVMAYHKTKGLINIYWEAPCANAVFSLNLYNILQANCNQNMFPIMHLGPLIDDTFKVKVTVWHKTAQNEQPRAGEPQHKDAEQLLMLPEEWVRGIWRPRRCLTTTTQMLEWDTAPPFALNLPHRSPTWVYVVEAEQQT